MNIIDHTKPLRRIRDRVEARYIGTLPGPFPHVIAHRIDKPEDEREIWSADTYCDGDFLETFENAPPRARQTTNWILWPEEHDDQPWVYTDKGRAFAAASTFGGRVQEVTITEELPW